MRLWNLAKERIECQVNGRMVDIKSGQELDVPDHVATHLLRTRQGHYHDLGLVELPFEVGTNASLREKIKVEAMRRRLQKIKQLWQHDKNMRQDHVTANMGDPGPTDWGLGYYEEIKELESFFGETAKTKREEVLEKYKDDPEVQIKTHDCEECEFKAKTPAGLAAHKRARHAHAEVGIN